MRILLETATCTFRGQNKNPENEVRVFLNLINLKDLWRNIKLCLPLTFSSLSSPLTPMDFSRSLRLQTLEFPLRFQTPIDHLHQNPTFSVPGGARGRIVSALRRPPIEGLSEELNSIARRNLDFARTRRQVRSAFVEVQEQLDHVLFKVGFFRFYLRLTFLFLFIVNHLIVRTFGLVGSFQLGSEQRR